MGGYASKAAFFVARRLHKIHVTNEALQDVCVRAKTSVHEATPGMWDGPNFQSVYLGCVVNASIYFRMVSVAGCGEGTST